MPQKMPQKITKYAHIMDPRNGVCYLSESHVSRDIEITHTLHPDLESEAVFFQMSIRPTLEIVFSISTVETGATLTL